MVDAEGCCVLFMLWNEGNAFKTCLRKTSMLPRNEFMAIKRKH